MAKGAAGSESTALVPSRAAGGDGALTRHDMVECKLYPHIKTKEHAGVVMARAVNHDLCPTFVAENLIPIQGKMAGTGLYLAAVLGKSSKYRTVTAHNDATKAVIEFWELVPYAGQGGNPAWVKKGTETFTIDDAKKAGLLGNQTWAKYPQHMVYWRALAGGARKHCPDAIAGSFKYLAEELDDKGELDFDEEGAVVGARKGSGKGQGRAARAGAARHDADFSVIDAEIVMEKADVLQKRVETLLAETGTDEAKVLGHFGAESLESMQPEDLADAVRLLEAKRAPAAAKGAAAKAKR